MQEEEVEVGARKVFATNVQGRVYRRPSRARSRDSAVHLILISELNTTLFALSSTMSQSRLPLPRIRSSSPVQNSAPGPSMKRKAIPEEDEESEQPVKKLARGHLQPSRTATNLTRSSNTAPKSVTNTKPRAPTLGSNKSTSARGTSAPPTNSARTASKPAATRGGRTASGSGRLGTQRASDDRCLDDVYTKLSSIDEARAADTARLAAEMEAERAKVVELQENHHALSRQLALSKEQELSQRAELTIASDELDKLRRKHAQEITELEMDLQKKDRVVREVNEELRNCRNDLDRERETVSSLKSTLNHEANAQLTLTSENRSLQTQNTALHAKTDTDSRTIAELTLKLETAQYQVDELRKEAMENESMRYVERTLVTLL